MLRLHAYVSSKRLTRRGVILVWAAICLILVMAFLAFALDYGYLVLTKDELQSAADSAALSGARALQNGRDAAIAAAQSWASKNVAAGKPVATVASEDVQIGLWDDSNASFTALAATSSTLPNAVRVTVRRTSARGNALKLFFAPAIGTKAANLSATATSRATTSRCGLIIGIPSVVMSGSAYTDSYNSENGPYSAGAARQKGHVCTNGVITMSGSAAIRGDAHPGVGKTVKRSGSSNVVGTISPLTKPLSYPPVDPGNAAVTNNNSSIPLSALNKQPLNSKKEFTLSGADSVALSPGTYYFSKLALSGGSTIKISGPTTIYVTGDVALSGGSVANLTFLPKNLQLFPMGAKCDISGSSNFYGLVYGPNTAVIRSGSADYFGAIIGADLTMSGSGGIHADEALDSLILGGTKQQSMLVE